MLKFIIPLLLLAGVFSVEVADYLVNMETEGGAKPYINVDAFNFGSTDYTVMFHVEIESVTGTKRVVHFRNPNVGAQEDDRQFIFELVGNSQFGVCVGKQENFQPNLNLGMSLSTNRVYAFVIQVQRVSDREVHLTVFVDGVLRYENSALPGKLAQGSRVGTFGARRKADGTYDRFLNGLIDNVVILNAIATAAVRNDFTDDLDWNPLTETEPQVAFWMHFNDAILAVENQALAVTSITPGGATWVTGSIHGGAVFQMHNTGTENWGHCYTTGDPHYYNWNGQRVWTSNPEWGEKLYGTHVYQTCDDEDLEIRTHTRPIPGRWNGNSVFRLVSVKYKDYVWRVNHNEMSSDPYALGIAGGRFLKKVTDKNWNSLGDGSLIHETGMRYYGYGGDSFQLSSPDLFKLKIDVFDLYMNVYLDMNLDRCPNRFGSCDADLHVKAHHMFNDLLGPLPLPDIEIPDEHPCEGVSDAIMKTFEDMCKIYYPSNQNYRDDCVFDACASGDPDIIRHAIPTPECLMERLAGIDNPDCEVNTCQGNCYGRGNCTDGVCSCDSATHGGFDCYQENSFMCHDATFGSNFMNIQPKHLFMGRDDNFIKSFFDYSVMDSVLIYPTEYDGKTFMQVVVGSQDSPNGGSATVCFRVDSGSNPTTPVELVQSSTLKTTFTHTTISSNWATNYCIKSDYGHYSAGGFYFEVTPGTTFTVSVSGADQVLMGSENGRGGIDVAKVPQIYHSGVTYTVQDCDNTVCHQHDQSCDLCYNEPGCGYCMETQRCMKGDKTGPKRGFCENWRVSLDDDISRVVTTKYNGDDLVDPDYQVFLSTIATGDVVPVSIYVPTARTNDNVDVHFIFNTAGSFATNADSLKIYLLNALFSVSDNMNLGIGYYGDLNSISTLDLLRVHNNNQYLFARALETPSVMQSVSKFGGQFEALVNAAENTKFRRYSRRLIVLTVYGIPESDSQRAAARDALLDHDILTVFVIPRGVSQSVVDYWKGINNGELGIPSLVVRIDASGRDFYQAFTTLFSLSASYPHVVLRDFDEDQYTNVDTDALIDGSDSLSIFGLTNRAFRARFLVPMKRESVIGRSARINIPGFGHSIVEDVDSTDVTSEDIEVSAYENDPCVEITLRGSVFGDLFEPVFNIMSLPAKGTLHVKDANQADFLGEEVTPGFYTNRDFCFHPEDHDASIPAGSVYATFQYTASDGCKASPQSTVDITITPVYKAPYTEDVVLEIWETEQTTNHAIDLDVFEADRDDSGVQEIFEVSFKDPFVQYDQALFGAQPTDFYYTEGNPVSYSSSYGPFTTDSGTYHYTFPLEYRPPSEHFFGVFGATANLKDSKPLESDVNVVVKVTGVNDVPTASSVGDAVFDPSGVHQFAREDNTYTLTIIGEDLDNFNIGVDVFVESIHSSLQSASVGGQSLSATGVWYNDVCTSGSGSRTITCDITVVPVPQEFSCDLGGSLAKPSLSEVQSTCTTPMLKIKYRVNDHNNKYVDVPDGTIQEALSAEGVVNLHLLQINDPPEVPQSQVISMTEDIDTTFNVEVLVQDIDTGDLSKLDLYLRTVCDQNAVALTQQSSAVINAGDVVEDAVKRMNEQLHRFIATVQPNVHGASADDDFLLCTISMYSFDGNLTSLADGRVEIHVTPVNDAPYNLATAFSKDEDVVGVQNYLYLTATDIDNAPEDLTYVITQLPFNSFSEGLGVLVYPVDVTTNEPSTTFLTDDDLPYTVELNGEGDAVVYIQNVADWYGVLDGDDVLVYEVTDVDAYFGEDGIVHTVPSDVVITINPVNDRPIVTVQPPSGPEDTIQVIYLLGTDPKFGEDDDLDVLIDAIDIQYSSTYNASSDPSVFYHFDETWYNTTLVDTPTTLPPTPLLVGENVNDPKFRILLVPPLHMNHEADSLETPLYFFPRLKYNMVETFSHADPPLLESASSDWVDVIVQPVNDVPVTWGGEWNVLPGTSEFYGSNGWTSSFNDESESWDTTICVDNCYFLEDFGIEGHVLELNPVDIKFGGRDVEGDDLSVVIRNIDCLPGARFEIVTENSRYAVETSDLQGMTLPRMLERQNAPVGYQLTSLLSFAPGIDDWNVPADDESHSNDQSGTEQDYYCIIDYAVVDSAGLASDSDGADPKRITINVKQVNDQPQDNVLTDPDNTASTLITYEDSILDIKFDGFDKEGDDFVMTIQSCEERGTFYLPGSAQSNFINEDGDIEYDETSDINSVYDMSNPINCSDVSTLDPLSYSDTDEKGWFLLFVPSEDEYGSEYSGIVVSYDDEVVEGQTLQTSSRKITVRPINDAPVVLRAGVPYVDNGDVKVLSKGSTQNLEFSFSDDDALTTSGQEYGDLGFQYGVTKIELTGNNELDDLDADGAPYTYSLLRDDFLTVISIDQYERSGDNITFGWFQWKSSISQANEIIRFSQIQFDFIGAVYTVEVVVVDAGHEGYCGDGVVLDTATYLDDDIRSEVGVNGQLLGPVGHAETRCNRVAVGSIRIKATSNTAVIGGIATGAGAALLGLVALGAVAFAKLKDPEDLSMWKELENADLTNVQQSAAFKAETEVGKSGIYTAKQ